MSWFTWRFQNSILHHVYPCRGCSTCVNPSRKGTIRSYFHDSVGSLDLQATQLSPLVLEPRYRALRPRFRSHKTACEYAIFRSVLQVDISIFATVAELVSMLHYWTTTYYKSTLHFPST